MGQVKPRLIHRESLTVCVWVPNLHKEINQNKFCDTTKSG